jgi:hypothetical protein
MNDMIALIFLFLALIVLPGIYIWILVRLHLENVTPSLRFEFFVGLGTLGGWLLAFAFAGSGRLIILPHYMFQFFVAIPCTLFCLFRLVFRQSPSGFRKAAIAVLVGGLLLPFAIGMLRGLLDSNIQ